MTAVESSGEIVDAFALRPAAEAPTRPRLLSYVGRWGRARRWLPDSALRVLDVGCAFGYGTAAIGAAGPAARQVVGVERDPEHLAMAAKHFPWVPILVGDATALPVADASADAVLLLDVLEHIATPEQALAEIRRVLRPDGTLVVSVPHAGLLRWLDALNLYAALRRRFPALPPWDAATESDGGPHRHYTVAQLREELAPWFEVDAVARTGLGLQEFVTILAIILRVALRARRLSAAIQPLHLLVYILDDMLPAGPLAYHLAVRARPAQTETAP